MTHSDVTLDVEGWCPGESEGLHVCVDERLVHGQVVVHPNVALELGDQLGVHRATVVVDQLNLLVSAIVCLKTKESSVCVHNSKISTERYLQQIETLILC